MNAQADADPSQNGHAISDFDDDDTEGEVPFVTRKSAGTARHSLVANQDHKAADVLPTHFSPPRLRAASMDKDISHHSERSTVPLHPE